MKHISRHTNGTPLGWRSDYYVISACLMGDVHYSVILNKTQACTYRPVEPTSSL